LAVSTAELEQTLRDLPRVGQLIKDQPYRQVWRFDVGGKGYYLKFYPRRGGKLKRMFRGNPAMREFVRLQWLQKAEVPAPRAVAVLSGFKIGEVTGDVVISEAIEPAETLDRYFNNLELRGERAPDHRALSQQVRETLLKLKQAGLGHDDLHLGNFLKDDKGVYLLDAYAVTPGGLHMKQVLRLWHSVARYATRQDLMRGFAMLKPHSERPRANDLSPGIWRKFLRRITGGNRYFGKVTSGEWSGVCFKYWKYPYRFSPASRLQVSEKDWEREWPLLWKRVEGGLLEILKTSRSGDVLAGDVNLAGHPVEVIVKRARRKKWYRYVNEIGRGSRSWRAWKKAWNLLVRGIPTAWPLIVMERRVARYVVDQAIVFERVPGKTLALTNLDLLAPDDRVNLFRRCGRILRRIEEVGFSHFDSKSSNWMIKPDEKRGPTPVLVDVDGVRFYRWTAFGIQRLLKSMREHRQYTPLDSLELCEGYAPFIRMEQELQETDIAGADETGTTDQGR
jgi:tRNA A-37 threonylcarbamoyl transferase component Bud32